MALNIITAKFCSGATQTWTDEAWQYDYGQVLQLEGLELPDAYQVHFSNTPMSGNTVTQIGGADGVTEISPCKCSKCGADFRNIIVPTKIPIETKQLFELYGDNES